jgi:hypothetical protein
MRRHPGEEGIFAKELIPRKEPIAGEEMAGRKELILEEEVIVWEEVIAHVVRDVAAGKSKIAATRLAETTRNNPSGDEPKWRRTVPVDLARLDLRHAELARRVSQTFRFARRLAPTDDVTTVGGRL